MHLDENIAKILWRVHVNAPWSYLLQHIETILEHRINVEIGFDGNALDYAPRKDLARAARQLSDGGSKITFHGPFWDLSSGSIDSLIRQVTRHRFEQLYEMVEIFNPIQIVCHTGYDPRHHGGYRQAWIDCSLATWEPLVKKSQALKTPLLIENVWEEDPEIHRLLINEFDNPYFGFCLDVGHQNSYSKTPLPVWLETLWEHLHELHLHDNDGSRDAHLPIGQGEIDFRGLFAFLRERQCNPLITLEPHCEEHLAETMTGLLEVMDSE